MRQRFGLLLLAGSVVAAAAQTPAGSQREGYVLVANQQSANASLINLSTDEMKLIPVGQGPHEAVISPSGAVGVVTIYGTQVPGNELAIIDIRKGTVTRTISLGEYTRPHGAVFLPGNETRVVVTSETTQNIVLVDIANGKVEGAIPTGALTSHMVAITRDGKRAFTSNMRSGGISEMDVPGKSLVRTIAVAPQVEGVAVTPDGSIVLAGSNANGTVSLIETKTGAIASTLSGFSLPYRIATSPDGRLAIVCDPQANRIHVIDIVQRKVVWALDGLEAPRGVTIAPDGNTAFVTLAGAPDGNTAFVTLAGVPAVGIVDLKERKLVRRIGVGASPDGVGYGVVPK